MWKFPAKYRTVAAAKASRVVSPCKINVARIGGVGVQNVAKLKSFIGEI